MEALIMRHIKPLSQRLDLPHMASEIETSKAGNQMWLEQLICVTLDELGLKDSDCPIVPA